MPSQAKQKVTSRLWSGNGVGIQFWSACRASPALPSGLMLPTNRPARMALPTLNSANAMIFGNVATRSTAGCLPSSIGADAMSVASALFVASVWIATRKSSISSGGAASRITA